MNIQEKFDGITKIQKILLYNISILLFIFSFVFIENYDEEIGFTLLLLGLLYLDILLFFEFKHFNIKNITLIKRFKSIGQIVIYLFLFLILLSFLIISFITMSSNW